MTRALVSINDEGRWDPISDPSKYNTLGLFMGKAPSQKIRLCNDEPVTLWVDGRMFQRIAAGCEIILSDELFKRSTADTIYLSIYTDNVFEGLKLEHIAIEKSAKVENKWARIRSNSNHLEEFVITALIALMCILGTLVVKFPNRIRYVLSKAFNLKTSSYEIVNFHFLDTDGISFCAFLSALVGFFWVYFSERPLNGMPGDANFIWLNGLWLKVSGIVFMLILGKWILASIISQLFSFSKIHDYQIFDFINICLNFCLILFAYFIMDFVFKWQIQQWHAQEMFFFMTIVLTLSMLFLGLKFVSNYPHKKLLIISYLCATEIIPAIILAGWFYK